MVIIYFVIPNNYIMQGMSQTLYIIVAAVVILVSALVILTVFGSGINPLASISSAESSCMINAKSTCDLTGQLPMTWESNTVNDGGKPTSCSEVLGCNSCAGCFPDSSYASGNGYAEGEAYTREAAG